jgi:hypothetical protein
MTQVGRERNSVVKQPDLTLFSETTGNGYVVD